MSATFLHQAWLHSLWKDSVLLDFTTSAKFVIAAKAMRVVRGRGTVAAFALVESTRLSMYVTLG